MQSVPDNGGAERCRFKEGEEGAKSIQSCAMFRSRLDTGEAFERDAYAFPRWNMPKTFHHCTKCECRSGFVFFSTIPVFSQKLKHPI